MTLRPIYYDTETMGVKAERDRIIEIAAFDPEQKKSFSELINPGCPIPKEASDIHHISDDMVKDAPPFSQVAPKFIEFCKGNTVLIAHNNDSFDKHFLFHEFSRNDLRMPAWKFFDTLKWARKYRPDLPRHSLQYLREIFGIEANNAHRALDDVIMLEKVFSMMIDDLDFETIYRLIYEQESDRLRMPFGKHKGTLLKDMPGDYVKWLESSGALEKPENQQLKTAFEELGFLSKEMLLL